MIGKVVTNIITNTAAITSIIGTRLFAVNDYFVSSEENFPSLYYIVRLVPDYYKNGRGMNTWSVTLLSMCTSYAESWDLAMKIISAFEATPQQTIEGYRITKARATSVQDEYEFNQGGTYGQTIEFEIKTNEI